MKKSEEIRWGRSMITTCVMILLIVAASFCVIHCINEMEEAECFNRLYEEADDLAEDIEMYADSDREELKMLSAMIAEYDKLDSADLWDFLDSYTAVGMMSRIELLLPDDTVLVSGGETVDAKGMLSFKEEAAQGEHVTNREADILDSGNYIVRHYVPVIKEGEAIAMLYGVIELGELPKKVNMDPYSGEGAMYIIDGNTGDFLVDTWHQEEGGNMWALGEREMAPGYDPEQLKQGVKDGDSRYVVFISKTAGEYLYFYYKPIGINEWRIAVSVPESVVFESADMIGRILNLFLMFELLCFIVYFLWMACYVRKVTGEKQRRLESLNYIYDVEKLLFNAHEKKENINAALEKIGSIIRAEQVGFWIVGQSYDQASFIWKKEQTGNERNKGREQNDMLRLLEYFKAGNSEFEAYDEKGLREMGKKSGRNGIHNMVAVPVEDMEGEICGILESCNIKDGHASAALLKNMKFSFSMFCRNLKIHTKIREQGDRDALTGLYNRNRYERDLQQICTEHGRSLACVYIDVNGLHEMNNTNGHDKGDKMLKTVANAVRKNFDTEYSYRFGGDEFIVFVPDAEETEVKLQSEAFTALLVKQDYHVSVGIQCETEVSSMAALIKSAEKKMYVEKKRYYEQEFNDRRRTARE